jgi:hypothetical protein
MIRPSAAGCFMSLVMAFSASADNHAHMETVQELLAACDSSDQGTQKLRCKRTIGGAFQAVIFSEMSPSGGDIPPVPENERVCFPRTNDVMETFGIYKAATLGWLRAHPELQSEDSYRALGLASVALWPCGK